jgi:hypothetical protein
MNFPFSLAAGGNGIKSGFEKQPPPFLVFAGRPC